MYVPPSLAPTGITFGQAKQLGAPGHLALILNALQAGTLAPTSAPTLSATGGGALGGSLSAGTYYFRFTESNGLGETTPSPEASVTISPGNIPSASFPALQAGNSSRNLYVGTAPGAERLYQRGITASSVSLSADLPTTTGAVPPPRVNSTALTYADASGTVHNRLERALKAAGANRLQGVWDFFHGVYSSFTGGGPVAIADVIRGGSELVLVGQALAQVGAEFLSLVDANAGHFGTQATGIGGQEPVRQWP